MEIVLASFFTLSSWAPASGTLGNLSPSFTLSVVSSAPAGALEASTQATAAKAARAAKRSMAELRDLGTGLTFGAGLPDLGEPFRRSRIVEPSEPGGKGALVNSSLV